MDIIPPKFNKAEAYQKPSSPQPDVSIKKTPKDPNSEGKLTNILSTIGLVISALAIAFLLNAFVIQSYQVDGQSMETTLQNNDRLLVYKVPRTISRISSHQYIPHRGDIIIFNQSGLPGFIGEKQLIKRVIGLPGERVVIKDGLIAVYNQSHPNGFNPDTSSGYHIAAKATIGDIDTTLKSNEIFVCGDNRNNSEDSRYFGPIKSKQIVAKLVFRILPLNSAQSF